VTYATLMVQLELGHSNAGLLRITGDLAERFHASVIGIAVCQPMQIVYGDGYFSGEIIEQNYEEIEKCRWTDCVAQRKLQRAEVAGFFADLQPWLVALRNARPRITGLDRSGTRACGSSGA
jgi:hypothetical protein